MRKETFLEFLEDQKKKKYSAELILRHLKNAWLELENDEEESDDEENDDVPHRSSVE